MLFALTPTTVSLSLLGHIIYGVVIELLVPYVYGKGSAKSVPSYAAGASDK
jgi:hypothetical protein